MLKRCIVHSFFFKRASCIMNFQNSGKNMSNSSSKPDPGSLLQRVAFHIRLPCTTLVSKELPLDGSALGRSRNTLDSEVHSVRECRCNRV